MINPLYDYEKIIFDSSVTHDSNTNKQPWIKKQLDLVFANLCLGLWPGFVSFDNISKNFSRLAPPVMTATVSLSLFMTFTCVVRY